MDKLIFQIMDWLFEENNEAKTSLTSDEKLALFQFIKSHLNEIKHTYSDSYDWYEYIWKKEV